MSDLTAAREWLDKEYGRQHESDYHEDDPRTYYWQIDLKNNKIDLIVSEDDGFFSLECYSHHIDPYYATSVSTIQECLAEISSEATVHNLVDAMASHTLSELDPVREWLDSEYGRRYEPNWVDDSDSPVWNIRVDDCIDFDVRETNDGFALECTSHDLDPFCATSVRALRGYLADVSRRTL